MLQNVQISRKAKTYLSAVGAAAIYVSVEHGRTVGVGVARDVDKALQNLRRTVSASAAFGWLAWAMNYDGLVHVAQNVKVVGPVADVAKRVTMACDIDGIRLTSHQRAVERAQTCATYLDRALSEMRRAGTLSTFNRAYRLHREDCASRGASTPPYWAVMQELRGLIVRQLIAEQKQVEPALVLAEMRQKFPWFAQIGKD